MSERGIHMSTMIAKAAKEADSDDPSHERDRDRETEKE
jgi:hypothetical protein